MCALRLRHFGTGIGMQTEVKSDWSNLDCVQIRLRIKASQKLCPTCRPLQGSNTPATPVYHAVSRRLHPSRYWREVTARPYGGSVVVLVSNPFYRLSKPYRPEDQWHNKCQRPWTLTLGRLTPSNQSPKITTVRVTTDRSSNHPVLLRLELQQH